MNQQFISLHTISPSPQHVHIASLVAHVRPAHFHKVYDWITQQSQQCIHIEIYAEEPAMGKLVIVTESAEEKAIVNFLDELRGQTGVLNTALVYHEYLSPQDLLDE